MNKHIRLLIENITDDIFNDDLLNTEDTYTTISNEIFYNYLPESKQELRTLLKKLLIERGKDADLNDIDVSNITDMEELFRGLDPHNIDIRYWDMSNVENMADMFVYCHNFNSDLSGWDVSNVKDMYCMFWSCENFDSDLSGWDVSNVEVMGFMFYKCKKFTGRGLDKWKPIKCNRTICMFAECSSLTTYPSWYKK